MVSVVTNVVITYNNKDYCFTYILIQDISKRDESTKDMEESSNLIPQLEEKIPKLQELLNEEEKVLEQIKGSSRGEVNLCHPCSLDYYV